jgi:hypothetical protein
VPASLKSVLVMYSCGNALVVCVPVERRRLLPLSVAKLAAVGPNSTLHYCPSVYLTDLDQEQRVGLVQ